MNRAPITNGHSTEAASARSGYDAYFAQIEERSDSDVAGDAAASGYSQSLEASGVPADQPATSPPAPQDSMSQDGAPPSGAVSAPEAARGSAVPGQVEANVVAAEHVGSEPAARGTRSDEPAGNTDAVEPPQQQGSAPVPPADPPVSGHQQQSTVSPPGASLSLQEQRQGQTASNATHGVPQADQAASNATKGVPHAGHAASDMPNGVPNANQTAPNATQGPSHADQAAPNAAQGAPNTAQAAQASSGAVSAANEQQAAPNPGGYVQGHGPAASEPATSWVPDRVQHAGYEPTPRVEVLPPNLSLSSAELLADIAAVRQAQLRSTHGVRGALNKVGFSLGLSPAEQRAENRRNRVRRQLTDTYQIAVVSVKGGVGRTTTAAALGSTFSSLRPDRVVAIDANPDFGDLTTRTARHPYGLTMRDLTRSTQRLEAFSAVHAYTSINAADLAVVASPWNTDANEALSGSEYTAGTEVLRRHYNLLVVDCGTGVLDSVTNTVLRTSDAVVVVTPATVGGVTGAVATLNWLSSHGFDRLIANSMVGIVHHQPNKPMVEVSAIEKLFATAQRPTWEIPYDEHLAEGGEIDLRLLEKETALAFEEIAAGLADSFPGQGPGTAPSMGDRGGWR